MRFRFLPVVIATVIGLSAQANAAREHYLVGLRHVYMFDVWPDTHKEDRQAIEESYAADVAAGQQQYDADMASIRDEEAKYSGNVHQIDRDAVQQNLEQAIGEAADKRDASLSQLYVECDYVRASHPEFAVDQDGPYQVMGIDVAADGTFNDVVFYCPYPMYLGPCPFGWGWGRPYPFVAFGLQVSLFHSTWLSIGSPVFTPMYSASGLVVVLAPVRMNVIVNRANWAAGRPPVISDDDRKALTANKELQRKAGIRPPSAHPGVIRTRSVSPPGAVSRYARSHPASKAPAGPPTSRYSHVGARIGAGSSSSTGSRTRNTGGGTGGSRTRTGGEAHGTAGAADKNAGGDKKKGG